MCAGLGERRHFDVSILFPSVRQNAVPTDGDFRILLFHNVNVYYYRIDNNNDNRRRGRMFDGAFIKGTHSSHSLSLSRSYPVSCSARVCVALVTHVIFLRDWGEYFYGRWKSLFTRIPVALSLRNQNVSLIQLQTCLLVLVTT